VLCIVYWVPGISSVVYWVLGHWVFGPNRMSSTKLNSDYSSSPPQTTLLLMDYSNPQITVHLQPLKALLMHYLLC